MNHLGGRLSYLRLHPFDVGTEAGRTAERYRVALWSAIANFGARGVSMLAMVISVSLTVGYLGGERFGAWAVLSSLVNMLCFMDLGVGHALVNRVAHAVAAGKPDAIRKVIGGGLGVLAVIAFTAWALLAGVAAVLPWDSLLKLRDPQTTIEVGQAAQVLSLLFAINVFSNGCLKTLIGQQRAFEAHAISLVGALLSCIGVWFAAHHQAGIPVLLLATFGTQAIAGLVALTLFSRRGQLMIGRDLLDAALSQRAPLLRTGGVFLALQIGAMVGWGCDGLLLASVRGASDVATLVIAQRLFLFASQPIAVFNAPLWAAYADANARGDRAFMRQTLRHSLALSIGSAAGICMILLCVSPWLVPAWTRGLISTPWSLLIVFAVWTLIDAAGNAFAMYLNGVGLVREQLVVVVCFCVVVLPMKFYGAAQAGPTGLMLATTVSYLVTVVLLYSTVLRSRVLQPLNSPLP